MNVAVEGQHRYRQQRGRHIRRVGEVGPVVELQQPGYQEKPSYPYRNPQAVAQVVWTGPIRLPAGPCHRIARRGLQIQGSTRAINVRRSTTAARFDRTLSNRYKSTPSSRYKRTLRCVMWKSSVDATVVLTLASRRATMSKSIARGLVGAGAVLLAILLTGCTDAPNPTPLARAVPSPTVTAQPGVTPEPTPTLEPTPTAEPTHTPYALRLRLRPRLRLHTRLRLRLRLRPSLHTRLRLRPRVRRSSLWGWRLLCPVHAEMEPTISPCRSPACWDATALPRGGQIVPKSPT